MAIIVGAGLTCAGNAYQALFFQSAGHLIFSA